jgi:hypothetical protein
MRIYLKKRISSVALLVFIFFPIVILFSGCAKRIPPPKVPIKETWDNVSQWEIYSDGKSTIKIKSIPAKIENGLGINYILKGDPYGWVLIRKHMPEVPPKNIPITFFIKADGTGNLEIKFVDNDGSTFLKKISLAGKYRDWTQIVVYKDNLEYGWGGDGEFNGLTDFEIAISGEGSGTIWLDEIGFGSSHLKATFAPAGPVLDPDRELPGVGFEQRRATKLIPEDPLVLEWLKQIQDISSPEQKLLPSMEDNQFHTFNNSLAAMTFILKGERERAQRILDFFVEATVRENQSPTLQNFFYKGDARGFFQYVIPKKKDGKTEYHNPGDSDRWIGDMAWLLIAYKYYEKTYNSNRYQKIAKLLKDLLISFYKDADDGLGGYIQSGWRKGDSKLHEDYGHPEGNIDCYAAFELYGEEKYARKIRIWLERALKRDNLPLDLYTWRVLVYGRGYSDLLNIPEYDLRYRKTLNINGKKVMGLFPFPDININNIWLDGTGHIACAYFAIGNKERGYFYANQLDAFLTDRVINGVRVRSLPYTANQTGGFEWVRPERGFISVAAWYIFAKNQFNPLTLEHYSFK